MASRTDALLVEALSLAVDERVRLARELLVSVDGEPDDGVDAAWAEEIARREARAMDGASEPVEWASVRDEAAARLRRDR